LLNTFCKLFFNDACTEINTLICFGILFHTTHLAKVGLIYDVLWTNLTVRTCRWCR